MGRNPGVMILMLLVGAAGLAGYLVLGWLGAALSVSATFALAQLALERGNAVLLGWLGAHPVPDRLAAERLSEVLDRVSSRTGIEPPALWMTEGDQINVFAVSGMGAGGPSICVTRGCLDALDESEAEALLTLQAERIRSGTAESASLGALVGGLLARAGGMGFIHEAEAHPNPFGLLTAAVTAPPAAMAVRLAACQSREREAERRAAELLGRPDTLIRVLERAEFSSYARPLDLPAALGATGVVPPRAGAPSSSLARLYHPGIPVAHRAALLQTGPRPSLDTERVLPAAA